MTATKAITGIALLAQYDRTWLRPDVVAGVTVAAYVVPEVMADAQLAGLAPVVGLWSAILHMTSSNDAASCWRWRE